MSYNRDVFGCNGLSNIKVKIFILSSESPLKVRKMIVYCFLISFLVPEFLRFKDLKNCRKRVRKCEVLNKINQN